MDFLAAAAREDRRPRLVGMVFANAVTVEKLSAAVAIEEVVEVVIPRGHNQ